MQRRVMSAGESKLPALRRVVPRDDGVRGAQKRPLIDTTATHFIKRAQLVKMFSIDSHRRLPESQNDDVALARPRHLRARLALARVSRVASHLSLSRLHHPHHRLTRRLRLGVTRTVRA